MAHKKGVGSSKNGRESESKRLGIKIFGGQLIRVITIYRKRDFSDMSCHVFYFLFCKLEFCDNKKISSIGDPWRSSLFNLLPCVLRHKI